MHCKEPLTRRPCTSCAGHEQVKVVEQQHLETQTGEDGVMTSMTMTSQPHLWVPGMGNVQIGDVCFHVYTTDGNASCKVGGAASHHPSHYASSLVVHALRMHWQACDRVTVSGSCALHALPGEHLAGAWWPAGACCAQPVCCSFDFEALA